MHRSVCFFSRNSTVDNVPAAMDVSELSKGAEGGGRGGGNYMEFELLRQVVELLGFWFGSLAGPSGRQSNLLCATLGTVTPGEKRALTEPPAKVFCERYMRANTESWIKNILHWDFNDFETQKREWLFSHSHLNNLCTIVNERLH